MADKALTWRQLKGIQFWVNEFKNPGFRPFGIGFIISFGVIGAYAQMKFTDEMKANSKYWQSFHAPKKH
eukprot:CAMPEP_0116062408 /NCGR_PEP_ID=MMETSP0322-20121206/7739_1 /TAXON_ID=163516 /ORGANISM="Leptocylindrus danicus var. apora, Strain B651" /LENGTH=68 /DNA_ID=CAMNT_0003547705 /DNA_START=106 /DNA_END=312 /DNA_ORIENTATION=-